MGAPHRQAPLWSGGVSTEVSLPSTPLLFRWHKHKHLKAGLVPLVGLGWARLGWLGREVAMGDRARGVCRPHPLLQPGKSAVFWTY